MTRIPAVTNLCKLAMVSSNLVNFMISSERGVAIFSSMFDDGFADYLS